MVKLKIRNVFLKNSIIFLIANFFISCQNKEITIDEILSKSLKAHGGLELWQKNTYIYIYRYRMR